MTGDSRHQITKMVENMENMQIIKEISQTLRKHAYVHMLFNTRLLGPGLFKNVLWKFSPRCIASVVLSQKLHERRLKMVVNITFYFTLLDRQHANTTGSLFLCVS